MTWTRTHAPSEPTRVAGFYADDSYQPLLGMEAATIGGSGDVQAPGANVMVGWLIVPVESITIDGAFFYTHTAGAAGTKARLGIFPVAAGAASTPLLIDSGEIAIDATGYKVPTWTAVALRAFTPYLAVILANDATFAYRHFQGITSTAMREGLSLGVLGSSTTAYRALTGAQAYGALPSSPPALTPNTTIKPPGVLWKVQR